MIPPVFRQGDAGPRPAAFEKPRYGTVAYGIALKVGWITPEEEQADRAAWEERRKRSLQTCHRYNLYERPRYPEPKDTGAYVPEMSAVPDRDRNLTPGAKLCLRIVTEMIYRQNRSGRVITLRVAYLMKALGKSRRTIQRYLRQLEGRGYINSAVVRSGFAKMCIGLAVTLMDRVFAPHHREAWPVKKSGNSGASKVPQNRSRNFIVPVNIWALKCMDGVYRSYMKTSPLLTPTG